MGSFKAHANLFFLRAYESGHGVAQFRKNIHARTTLPFHGLTNNRTRIGTAGVRADHAEQDTKIDLSIDCTGIFSPTLRPPHFPMMR
jgi:hypothetical protein